MGRTPSGHRPVGHVRVVGLGPGGAAWCTPEVRSVLARSHDWFGYGPYLDQAVGIVAPPPGAALHRSDNGDEGARARAALDRAASGAAVAVVSSGDPGTFAMAAAVLEELDAGDAPDRWAAVEVTVHPGVSAAQAAAARVGAPLGHDFCVLSLSDNLKPWAVVERRLDAVAGADLVIAVYNPRSRHRPDALARAVAVVSRHRGAATPVVVARDVGRPTEAIRVVPLGALADPALRQQVDMRTVLIVGSSRTRVVAGRGTYTPRTYPADEV